MPRLELPPTNQLLENRPVPRPHTFLPPADHFHWVSFLCFAGSVVFEGLRMVLTERLLGQVCVGGEAAPAPGMAALHCPSHPGPVVTCNTLVGGTCPALCCAAASPLCFALHCRRGTT